MELFLSFMILAAGLAMIIKGADFLVDGASSLARRFNISEIAIGLTIVAFGTSCPELIVNIFASIYGKNDITYGNIIGSNTFNIMFILGVSGLISPLFVLKNTVWKEIPFSFGVLFLLFLFSNDTFFGGEINVLSRVDALIFLVLFAGFLYYVWTISKAEPQSETDSHVKILGTPKTIIYLAAGFFGLFLGGKLVVDNAVIIAKILGVSEKLIALTIVAGGTSLPELATSAVAAWKKRSDIAVGNIVGSNIFNIIFILGVSGLIRPVQFDTAFNIDMAVLFAATAFLFITMFTGKKKKLDRWESLILLLGYIGYTIYLIYRS